MRVLTHKEAADLYTWAVENHKLNWGGWSNYPVTGCSYLQFDDNPLVVKFDEVVRYQGENFKRILWSRGSIGRGPCIHFATLLDLIPKEFRPKMELAPYHEFTHPDGTKFILKQSPFSNYPRHRFAAVMPNGSVRDNFSEKSHLYPKMISCKPDHVRIIKR